MPTTSKTSSVKVLLSGSARAQVVTVNPNRAAVLKNLMFCMEQGRNYKCSGCSILKSRRDPRHSENNKQQWQCANTGDHESQYVVACLVPGVKLILRHKASSAYQPESTINPCTYSAVGNLKSARKVVIKAVPLNLNCHHKCLPSSLATVLCRFPCQ